MSPGKVAAAERPVQIRNAAAREATEIGALLREAFDPMYMLSSPYASEFGDVLLASQADATGAAPASRILRIASREAQLEGVAISSRGVHGLHLDFIASRATSISRGVGSALLRDAKDLSNGRVTLNVFGTNHRACAFYARRGFRETLAVAFRVVNLGELPPAAAIECADLRDVSERARRDEASVGYGNLSLALDGSIYDLGLVGGKSIRVRSTSVADVAELAAALKPSFPERSALVLPVDTPVQGLPLLFEDVLLTMEWIRD